MTIAWITPKGELGIVAESRPYELQFIADGATTFSVIAGKIPNGMTLSSTGLLSGVPVAKINNQPIGQNVSYRFTVRAGNDDGVADRTFSIDVAATDEPVWITAAGRLGTFLDSTEIAITLEAEDADQEPLEFFLISGELPPGCQLTSAGISGIIARLEPLQTTTVLSREFNFVIGVSDTKTTVSRSFSIMVYDRSEIPTDPELLAEIENTNITTVRPPIITVPHGSIGTYRHSNFYAFHFGGVDYDNEPFDIIVVGGALPPGTQLDPDSGWLYGHIDDLGLSETIHTFSLVAQRRSDTLIISDTVKEYSLTLIGNIETELEWVVDTGLGGEVLSDGTIHLGKLLTGIDSLLYIKANVISGAQLEYAVIDGSLPFGTRLSTDGLIIGRPTFSYHYFGEAGEGTERIHTFTVEATNPLDSTSIFQNFQIIVDKSYDDPWQNIYIKALPPKNDRDVLTSLLTDSSIIPPETIYRNSDPRFGVADSVVYYHAYGVPIHELDDYIAMFDRSHYRRLLTLGEVETAKAVDLEGNTVYEVVYCKIIDDLENADGISVNERVILSPPPVIDSVPQTGAYPASLVNMRARIYDELGDVGGEPLPLWMTSKQSSNKILGFVKAWVIAYVVPGEGERVAYNISEQFPAKLNTIDFDVERYVVEAEPTVLNDGNLEVPVHIINEGDELNQYALFTKKGLFE